MPEHELAFTAEYVEGEADHTNGDPIYMIAFGVGDPENGGHSWHFSREFDDDWGVCTVREIQRVTLYDGIAEFKLHRNGLECRFDPTSRAETGISVLRVHFDIDDDTWQSLIETAVIVFRDKKYFHCSRQGDTGK